MPNPFDLYGPEFLVFYIALGLFTLWACYWWIRRREANLRQPKELQDPYEIAYLRGGAREVLRVVLVSLIERGLLKQSGSESVKVNHPRAFASVRRNIERQVLQSCESPRKISELFSGRHYENFKAECGECREPLQVAELLFSPQVLLSRLGPVLLAFAVLGGTAAQKIHVALERGRHNLEFLVWTAIVFGVILLYFLLRPRTMLGDMELHSLKRRFEHLKTGSGGGDDKFKTTMLAAVFGLGALPELAHPYVHTLFPHARSGDGGGGCAGSGCAGGSGCGGGGGGSGCGGGGCGGCGG